MIGVTAGRVIVRHGAREWSLGQDESLTIGRSEECVVRLTDPEISRNACLLRVASDLVLVINQSEQKPLVVRPPYGEDRRVPPRGAATSLPYRTFEIVFAGRDDEPVGVRVDARGLELPAGPVPNPREPRTRGAGDRDLVGHQRPSPGGRRAIRMQAALLTPRQRVALIALCEPMVTRNGDQARPRSTAELAARLGWTHDYARNVVKDVRYRLAEAGVPGLVPVGATPPGGTDLRVALARWAVEYGAVGRQDLADLPPPAPRRPPTDPKRAR